MRAYVVLEDLAIVEEEEGGVSAHAKSLTCQAVLCAVDLVFFVLFLCGFKATGNSKGKRGRGCVHCGKRQCVCVSCGA